MTSASYHVFFSIFHTELQMIIDELIEYLRHASNQTSQIVKIKDTCNALTFERIWTYVYF